MSKILPFLLPFALLLFFGCPKDEADPGISEADLIGVWAVPKFDGDFTVDGNFLGQDLNKEGTSRITQSDLQIKLTGDSKWTSSGEYTLTVMTDTDTDVTQQSGIGGGDWRLRSDTLYLTGLENFANNGKFSPSQACTVTDFSRGLEVGLIAEMDHRERNADYDIDIHTRGKWRITLLR